ncbi:MAG: glutamine synthetase family protein [Pseudodesulfovibrio sp.]|uniref:Glutamate--putrescine ligase n=1 Tax=Pseudodesulfovibrio aespoeensis (strain ATCC 700646 / DSM 10631 / Aspo-2) TaxID=643562 RepID=E6VTH5_PSEA9|nr:MULTISPECIES: glutamine synthetase family protein [Pseudodesulfovibrio]MBU4192751.1 glutamine synthetase family protein [Pseudomonadota bacterium]ADU62152.1 Glutamate--putrescine ligase [Pseudodesulfovibrio aespoeensis Aspo-2]MBU4377573.1 glutamine synthetase family protein [Pseudomonadota bacterium]MBU4474916.1 glutamine synthetase family protein [Pseudomonadota bacterium]MBU4514903.1 glutamine synthetase family protein [Pseudomonadota bacterium]
MSLPKTQSIDSIEKQIRDHDIHFVRFEQSDLHGVSRSKTVPVGFFMDYMKNGLNFYGGLLGLDIQSMVPKGTGYAEEVAFEDHCTVPDLSTFTVLPWVPNTANITVDPYWYDGRPAMASPRLLLRKIIDAFDAMGYICRLGYEFEFYVLDRETRKPVYGGQPIFVTLKNNFDINYTYDLMRKMDQAGVRIITQNSEHGPGQQEINLHYQDGLAAADTAFLYKMGAKEISLQHGYIATWLTKPFIDSSASGSHFHISLIDKKTGKNAFNDPEGEFGLSPLARNFLAGMLKHARANSVFTAPTINCYKRYRVNSFAPHSATWGMENRTVGIRLKGCRGESTHFENRLACGGTNPYLLALSTLASGLEGIRSAPELPAPVTGIAYERDDLPRLPFTLDEAIEAFEQDTELHSVLDPEFIKLVLAVKKFEVETAKAQFEDYGTPEFNNRVDPWEWDYFLELI